MDNRRAPAARRRYLFKYPNVPARATRAAVSLYRCDTQEVEFSLAFSPLYHMLHVMCCSCRVVSCSFQLSGRCSRLALRSVAFSFTYPDAAAVSVHICSIPCFMYRANTNELTHLPDRCIRSSLLEKHMWPGCQFGQLCSSFGADILTSNILAHSSSMPTSSSLHVVRSFFWKEWNTRFG